MRLLRRSCPRIVVTFVVLITPIIAFPSTLPSRYTLSTLNASKNDQLLSNSSTIATTTNNKTTTPPTLSNFPGPPNTPPNLELEIRSHPTHTIDPTAFWIEMIYLAALVATRDTLAPASDKLISTDDDIRIGIWPVPDSRTQLRNQHLSWILQFLAQDVYYTIEYRLRTAGVWWREGDGGEEGEGDEIALAAVGRPEDLKPTSRDLLPDFDDVDDGSISSLSPVNVTKQPLTSRTLVSSNTSSSQLLNATSLRAGRFHVTLSKLPLSPSGGPFDQITACYNIITIYAIISSLPIRLENNWEYTDPETSLQWSYTLYSTAGADRLGKKELRWIVGQIVRFLAQDGEDGGLPVFVGVRAEFEVEGGRGVARVEFKAVDDRGGGGGAMVEVAK